MQLVDTIIPADRPARIALLKKLIAGIKAGDPGAILHGNLYLDLKARGNIKAQT